MPWIVGKEARCRGTWNGAASEGKALLETDHVLFRGNERIRIELRDIKKAAASDGTLTIAAKTGTLVLHLGADADKWAHAIANPKGRIEKLGVKKGMRVSALGVTDAPFADELADAGADVSTRVRKESDLVFAQVDAPAALAKIAAWKASLAPAGGLWIVSPRGVAGLKDTDVMIAAKKAGLVDIKVVRFSETHSANKFVIPVKDRPKSDASFMYRSRAHR